LNGNRKENCIFAQYFLILCLISLFKKNGTNHRNFSFYCYFGYFVQIFQNVHNFGFSSYCSLLYLFVFEKKKNNLNV